MLWKKESNRFLAFPPCPFFWKRKRKSQNSKCCSEGPNGPTEREHRQYDEDLGGGETRLNSVLLVLRALRMRHTATDLRPPPPPWTANPQTPDTHNRIEAMDSGKNSDNDFSMDTKPPESDIDPGQTLSLIHI